MSALLLTTLAGAGTLATAGRPPSAGDRLKHRIAAYFVETSTAYPPIEVT